VAGGRPPIKVAAPRVALRVLDEAIQVHGAHGVRCGGTGVSLGLTKSSEGLGAFGLRPVVWDDAAGGHGIY